MRTRAERLPRTTASRTAPRVVGFTSRHLRQGSLEKDPLLAPAGGREEKPRGNTPWELCTPEALWGKRLHQHLSPALERVLPPKLPAWHVEGMDEEEPRGGESCVGSQDRDTGAPTLQALVTDCRALPSPVPHPHTNRALVRWGTAQTTPKES